MSLRKAASILVVLTGLLGGLTILTPLGLFLEESFGLDLLFRMRGVRPPSGEVLIVAIDEDTIDHLGLDAHVDKWPRSMHARLLGALKQAGARLVAFDVLFDEPREDAEDRALAGAIADAGNVILCESLLRDVIPMAAGGQVVAERFISPLRSLAEPSAALAPFPLPKIPVKVDQFWAFKGERPTLPVMALAVYSRKIGPDLHRLVAAVAPEKVSLVQWDFPGAEGGLVEEVRSLRALLVSSPAIGRRMLDALDHAPAESKRLLRVMVRAVGGRESRFLNLFGPAGSLATIPYHRLIERGADDAALQAAIQGKAVFVGVAAHRRADQRDGFHTVFSQRSGIDVSGVELAATAFANLLDDSSIEPLPAVAAAGVLLLWGCLLAWFCQKAPAAVSAGGTVVAGAAFLAMSHLLFVQRMLWVPVILPLAVQAPLAWIGGVLLRYLEANRERRTIRHAFGLYLPDPVVDRLSKGLTDLRAFHETQPGVCLCTDGERYTALSERMDPLELSRFLNSYFEVLFTPVHARAGVVSDIVGDSMMAIWTGADLRRLRLEACLAALEIQEQVSRFNRSGGGLPTRMGLHFGTISLGNVGGAGRFEYRPVGDTVNTASRIEGLNKLLGTRVLASESVLTGLDELLVREVGQFLLAGKSLPVRIYELVCSAAQAAPDDLAFCARFDEALHVLRASDLEAAIRLFEQLCADRESDGPSHYYLALCQLWQRQPSEGQWDGVIRLSSK